MKPKTEINHDDTKHLKESILQKVKERVEAARELAATQATLAMGFGDPELFAELPAAKMSKAQAKVIRESKSIAAHAELCAILRESGGKSAFIRFRMVTPTGQFGSRIGVKAVKVWECGNATSSVSVNIVTEPTQSATMAVADFCYQVNPFMFQLEGSKSCQ